MTLKDLEFTWVLAGAMLLCGLLGAVALLARGRRGPAAAAPGDSWERLDQRRRRKERTYAVASYTLLFCCAGVAAALSFHGLVGFGRENLNLSGGWEYLVPFGLDGAAMFAAVVAVREASHGDASLGSRMLVWLFAGAAAWFNWVHAPRGEEHAGAPHFFAGMSLSAAILFDRALKQTRRAALREQGLVPRPLPQIRCVRWLRAPRETYEAWSLMLLEGVGTLDEAVEEVREDRAEREAARARRRERRKLERARIKALNRQHRLWGRGRHRTDVPAGSAEAAPQLAEPPPVPEPGQLPPPAPRPALRRKAAEQSKVKAGVVGPAEATAPDTAPEGQASPRLDSLEEKLAQIERQFG